MVIDNRNTGPWNFAFCRVKVGCGSFRGKQRGFNPAPAIWEAPPEVSSLKTGVTGRKPIPGLFWLNSPSVCKKLGCGSFARGSPVASSPPGYSGPILQLPGSPIMHSYL